MDKVRFICLLHKIYIYIYVYIYIYIYIYIWRERERWTFMVTLFDPKNISKSQDISLPLKSRLKKFFQVLLKNISLSLSLSHTHTRTNNIA